MSISSFIILNLLAQFESLWSFLLKKRFSIHYFCQSFLKASYMFKFRSFVKLPLYVNLRPCKRSLFTYFVVFYMLSVLPESIPVTFNVINMSMRRYHLFGNFWLNLPYSLPVLEMNISDYLPSTWVTIISKESCLGFVDCDRWDYSWRRIVHDHFVSCLALHLKIIYNHSIFSTSSWVNPVLFVSNTGFAPYFNLISNNHFYL